MVQNWSYSGMFGIRNMLKFNNCKKAPNGISGPLSFKEIQNAWNLFNSTGVRIASGIL
jgi:hypothetical protein